jgi:hypothetical protein
MLNFSLMKIKYCILFICFCLSVKVFSQADSSVAAHTYPLKIILENLDNKKSTNKEHTRNLRIKIINKADTSFSFSIMTCSWDWNISFSPGNAYRNYMGCDKNIPQTITLKPKESFVLEDNFKLSDSTVNYPISISAGFRVTKPLPLYSGPDETLIMENVRASFNQFDYNAKYTYKDYIWSNPISIMF